MSTGHDRGSTTIDPSILSGNGKFPKEFRVRKRREFIAIHKAGVRVHTGAFTVIAWAREDAEHPRLGMAIGRRVGPAVKRNRVRRLLNEMFRQSAHGLPPVDFVVVARPEAVPLALKGLAALAKEIGPAMADAGQRAIARRIKGKRKGPRS